MNKTNRFNTTGPDSPKAQDHNQNSPSRSADGCPIGRRPPKNRTSLRVAALSFFTFTCALRSFLAASVLGCWLAFGRSKKRRVPQASLSARVCAARNLNANALSAKSSPSYPGSFLIGAAIIVTNVCLPVI